MYWTTLYQFNLPLTLSRYNFSVFPACFQGLMMIDAISVGAGPVRPNLTFGPLVHWSRARQPHVRSPSAPVP